MKTASHLPGAPCWGELNTPDVGAAGAFYGELFGWEAVPAETQFGGYLTLTLRGELTGAMKQSDHESAAGWHVYFTSEDLASTSKAVESAGGRVVSPARQVLDRGSAAYYHAPDGAGFGSWQPEARSGVGLMREPGAFSWFELNTLETERATSFYTDVFGWTSTTHRVGTTSYTDVKAPGGAIEFGGIMPRPGGCPPVIPIQWTPYFAVHDADAAAAKAFELGGSVVSLPKTLDQVGRVAALLDPHGAAFSVISHPEH